MIKLALWYIMTKSVCITVSIRIDSDRHIKTNTNVERKSIPNVSKIKRKIPMELTLTGDESTFKDSNRLIHYSI